MPHTSFTAVSIHTSGRSSCDEFRKDSALLFFTIDWTTESALQGFISLETFRKVQQGLFPSWSVLMVEEDEGWCVVDDAKIVRSVLIFFFCLLLFALFVRGFSVLDETISYLYEWKKRSKGATSLEKREEKRQENRWAMGWGKSVCVLFGNSFLKLWFSSLVMRRQWEIQTRYPFLWVSCTQLGRYRFCTQCFACHVDQDGS